MSEHSTFQRWSPFVAGLLATLVALAWLLNNIAPVEQWRTEVVLDAQLRAATLVGAVAGATTTLGLACFGLFLSMTDGKRHLVDKFILPAFVVGLVVLGFSTGIQLPPQQNRPVWGIVMYVFTLSLALMYVTQLIQVLGEQMRRRRDESGVQQQQ